MKFTLLILTLTIHFTVLHFAKCESKSSLPLKVETHFQCQIKIQQLCDLSRKSEYNVNF